MDSKSEKIQKESQQILDLLKSHEEGRPIEDILSEFQPEIGLRTLQRRIKELVQSKKIIPIGGSKAIKYKLVETSAVKLVAQETELLPLSKEGKEIQHAVLLPQQQRQPVGYNRTFLESYQPNITSYLTDEEKNKLADPRECGTACQQERAGLLFHSTTGFFNKK